MLVTGARGQLARALRHHLRARGVEVHGLSRDPVGPAPWHAWRSADRLAALLRAEGIAHVVHLASPVQADPARSATAALEGGIVGCTRAIGEACLDAGARLVHVGTCDEVAGGSAPFPEDAPPSPINAYAALKVAAAAHLRFLERAHGLDLVHVRPFRVVSPTDPRGLVAEACAAALTGAPLRLTAGHQRRQWCDPQAVATGLAACLCLPAGPHPTLHLCPGEEASVLDVVQLIFNLAGAPFAAVEVGAAPMRAGEALRLVGDDAAARALLGPLTARPLRTLLADALAQAAQRLQTSTFAGAPQQTMPLDPPPGAPETDGPLRAKPVQVEPLLRHSDARGTLMKALPHAISGEVYAVELRPGHPRGEHLHHASDEWFCALSGAAWLLAKTPGAEDQILLRLDGQQRVRVPAGVAHALWAADGQPALVLAGASRAHPHEQTQPWPLLAGRSWPDLVPAAP